MSVGVRRNELAAVFRKGLRMTHCKLLSLLDETGNITVFLNKTSRFLHLDALPYINLIYFGRVVALL
jgi:hypothetical protein